MFKLISILVTCLTIGISSFAQHQQMRLMSYNIRNAKGMDNKTDYDRTAAVIKNTNADIIALQELDSVTKRNGGEDVLKILGERTHFFFVYGAAIDYQGGKYGVGILSKQKPLKYYTVPLPGKEEQRVLLVAVYKKYVIFCTHWSLTDADRLTSAAIINKEAEKFTKRIYLLGDLNAEPNSNAIAVLKRNWFLISGEQPTFPAPVPAKCIDYIFTNKRKVKVISKNVLDEPMASDHRPVLVELRKR
ncbi:MAG TPA: endonuclease/exonuclease/phosphatase family protein [Chitinophagaceae bacterium]|nr:endonuclease/exonuclease/phosphatase family protein [Chitinophagaceae bacterium]